MIRELNGGSWTEPKGMREWDMLYWEEEFRQKEQVQTSWSQSTHNVFEEQQEAS